MKNVLFFFLYLLLFSFPLIGHGKVLPVLKALVELSCNNNLVTIPPSQKELAQKIDNLFGLYQFKKLKPDDPEIISAYQDIFFQTQKMLEDKKILFELKNDELRLIPDEFGVPLSRFAFHLEKEGLGLIYSPLKTNELYFSPYLENKLHFSNEVDHILSQKNVYLDNETLMTGSPGKLMSDFLYYRAKMKEAFADKKSDLYEYVPPPETLPLSIYNRYKAMVPTAKYNQYGMFYERDLLGTITDRLGEHGAAETFSTVDGVRGTIVFNQESWFRGVYSNESFHNESNLNFLKSMFFSGLVDPYVKQKLVNVPVIGAFSNEMKATFFITPSLMQKGDQIPAALRNLPDDYLNFIMGHYQERLKINVNQVKELKSLSESMKDRSHFLIFSHDEWVKKTGNQSYTPLWRIEELKSFDIYGGAVSVVSGNKSEKLPLEVLNGVVLERSGEEVIAEIGRLGFAQSEEKTIHVAQTLALYLKAQGVTKIYLEADRARTVLFRRFGFKIHSKISNQVDFYESGEANILVASVDDFLTASH
jgi:hypothetical protein